jgi:hypothetical protein
LAKDRAEHRTPVEREQDQRERESRESPETKYEEAVEQESEQRAADAARVADVPAPREENDGD